MKYFILVVISLAAFNLTAWGCAGEKKKDDHAGHDHDGKKCMAGTEAAKPAATETEVVTYPLDVCVVSGQKLGSMGDPVVLIHKGREVKLCCAGCKGAFEKDPEKYLAKVDEAVKAAEAKK